MNKHELQELCNSQLLVVAQDVTVALIDMQTTKSTSSVEQQLCYVSFTWKIVNQNKQTNNNGAHEN